MRAMLFFLTAILTLAAPLAAQPAHGDAPVLATIERWDRAWLTRDAALGAQDYSDDAHWVNAFGMRRTGREAIERTLAEVFALPFVAAGESQTVGHDVRYLGPGIAVVATSVERRGQLAPDGQPLGLRRTSHLRVLQRRAERWVIVSHLISDARDQQGPRH